MTLIQLEYLIAVDKYRSFSEAAKNCFVTQPTLSMQIQKLEEELGVILFFRDRYPIAPTPLGEKIIEQAKQILKEREKLFIMLQAEKGEYSGTLHIAIIPTISSYLLPLFLKNFTQKYPNIELIIDELITEEIIAGVNRGNIDVGLIALRSDAGNLLTQTLYYEPFVAFLPPHHPLLRKKMLRQNDLHIKDFLLLKEGHCLREQVLSICKISTNEWLDRNSRVIFETGNMETLIKLVDQQFGMTLLPYLSLQQMDAEKVKNQVRTFAPPVPKREVGLIYSSVFCKTHLLHALGEEILRIIPEELQHNNEGLIIH
ncbi:MAG: hydrogen peroxide-inducible genes activator [Bacteroidales bacterium]|nr:hydrogen peroxide-inducible genes activator [Bacteroidales bacterium]HOK99827.1 hydrogen peroxide-inducible genes activator [Bacteroidales bacterium]HPO66626.1 hydrogen peroxide-inducible genes activator [Bacteroidales bacterium]